MHIKRKLKLALAFAIVNAIAPSTPANSNGDTAWSWKDRNGNSYDRAELNRILDLHREWVSSRHKTGQRADLRGSKLVGADLRRAELSGLDLRDADLSNANMDGLTLGESSEIPAVPNPPMMLVVSPSPDPNPPASTYFDLFAYFYKALITPAQKVNDECDWKSAAHPSATDLSQARLVGAVLTNTRFTYTNLSGADLSGANLGGAQLIGVELKNAKLRGAFLSHAFVYQGHVFAADLSGADLTSASLWGSDLNGSDLTDAKLDDSNFHGTEVCRLNFEPKTIPSDIPSLASARGLELLTATDSTSALVALRGRLRDQGFRDQERRLTFAIKEHEAVEYWRQCISGSVSGCFDFTFNDLLFGRTCLYGLEPERALRLLVAVWFFCGILYWLLMRFPKIGGLYLTPPGLILSRRLRHSRIRRLGPRELVLRTHVTGGGTWSKVSAYAKAISFCGLRRRFKEEWKLLLASLFFSTMSAFNIGFKGVAAGRWVRLLTTRDYDILARGWPRVIAGLQSVMGVGLLALWLLTFFGRPFG
jgi:uncharacterized protein YjbI with pentapeptide repeats